MKNRDGSQVDGFRDDTALSRRHRVRFIGKRLAGIAENHGTKREGDGGREGTIDRREGADGSKEERGSLLLNEKLDRACRNAIFRRIHLVETFLPRGKNSIKSRR